jgi:homoserine O-acetyltransferase
VKQILAAACALLMTASMSQAADYPAPKPSDVTLKDFRFHTGEVMPALKIHLTTIGDPSKPAVLVLHGTGGSGPSMLIPGFAGTLFGAGQPLDAENYFLILPDAIGTGKSTKPSDGLRAAFPHYNYDDMVQAQYRAITEGLGVKHVHLVIGNSMGGMQTWLWGATYPGFMDKLVPMASQPTAMASRNWMMRRLLLESIRRDPAYMGGNYTTPPPSLSVASVMFNTATNGGTLAYQMLAPTSAKANALVDERLAAPTADANDFLWQWGSSEDFDPQAKLGLITAKVLAINSADDERNPPETGITVAALKQIKSAQLYLIPASTETRGHGTTGGVARLYAKELAAFLAEK